MIDSYNIAYWFSDNNWSEITRNKLGIILTYKNSTGDLNDSSYDKFGMEVIYKSLYDI